MQKRTEVTSIDEITVSFLEKSKTLVWKKWLEFSSNHIAGKQCKYDKWLWKFEH